MADVSWNQSVFDRREYERSGHQLRLVESQLPPESVSVLAREVVKRLAFHIPKSVQISHKPSDAQIEALCVALLSSDEDAGGQFIMGLQSDGVDIEHIHLGYVVGAARRFGEMWDEDEASFVEVTIGCGRLYRIIRGLRHVIAPGLNQGRVDAPALFALVPEETHTLGIEIATDLFRREGWDIDLALDMSHDELMETSETRSYQAIVLVANSDQMLGALTRLIVALRITQPLAQILVAGKIVNHIPQIVDITGVDAVIDRLETAVETVGGLVNPS